MKLTIKINDPSILQKVKSDKFGKFVANEWKRLINPYTPRRTGQLIGVTGATVEILPFEIGYKMDYAEDVYESTGRNFYQELSPFATDHWDQKAEKAGQKDKLLKTINAGLSSGRI